MWSGDPIDLRRWSAFHSALRRELKRLNHVGPVLVRNFQLVTADVNDAYEHLGETDRLQVVLETGVDRDATSSFWDAEGHDHRHDLSPSGKRPHDIIYAHLFDPDTGLVHNYDPPERLDLAAELNELDGILIYDPARLRRAAPNEFWFEADPRQALLAVFKLRQDDR